MKLLGAVLTLALSWIGGPASALGAEGAAVILERDARFALEGGGDVLVPRGNYFISVGAEPPLLVTRELEETALRLTARMGKHAEQLAEPRAESIRSGETQQHLLLLLPDGRSIDASGWVGDVATRSAAPLDAEAIARHRAQRAEQKKIQRRSSLEPRVADEGPEHTVWYPGQFEDQVIVKIHDGAAFRPSLQVQPSSIRFEESQAQLDRMKREGLTPEQARKDATALNAILAEPLVEGWDVLFDRDPLFLQDDRDQAELLSNEEQGDLENYYLLLLAKGDIKKSEALVDKLNAIPSVEIAYFAPVPKDASTDPPPPTPNLETKQRYLDPAPEGIDARHAWTVAGGRGEGWRVIDLEQGWNLDHEDFPGRFFPDRRYKRHEQSAGRNATDCGNRQHGTAVLGEMIALNDNKGVTGIVANAGWGVVSPLREYNKAGKKYKNPVYRLSEAINVACSLLAPGDAILIEQHMAGPNTNWVQNAAGDWIGQNMTDSGQACQCNCGQFGFIPMEYEKDTFDAIKNATARGIHVIEASGNGDMDLAHTRYRLKPGGKSRFDRSVRDSGAILVGASQGASRDPECFTNHGPMVDVHSWGADVVTTGYGLNQCTASPIAGSGWEVNGNADDTQWYTSQFSGTSSASPIVTGAVISISGVRRAASKVQLTPKEMRKLLRDTGTAQTNGGANGAKLIGPQPDLKRAIPAALAISP